jgi:hypothetical protein
VFGVTADINILNMLVAVFTTNGVQAITSRQFIFGHTQHVVFIVPLSNLTRAEMAQTVDQLTN